MANSFGPEHQWFAWRPVDTDDRGWRWLTFVWRRRQYLNIPGYAAMRFWNYRYD